MGQTEYSTGEICYLGRHLSTAFFVATAKDAI